MWFWNFNNASSNYGSGTGARLLIWELMCVSTVCQYHLLLSAVLILPLPSELACGVGLWIIFHLTLTSIAVLDSLYLKYTLRDLVCLVLVFRLCILFALVGGRYDNGINAGLWYWNVNNASSNYSINIGARPLIFIKYLHITFLSPC